MRSSNVFKCYGGPFNGEYKTIEEVGPDYTQYNSARGEVYPRFKNIEGNFYVTPKWIKKHRKIVVKPYIERCILVYAPAPVGFVRV